MTVSIHRWPDSAEQIGRENHFGSPGRFLFNVYIDFSGFAA
jgi:hypothetical protein